MCLGILQSKLVESVDGTSAWVFEINPCGPSTLLHNRRTKETGGGLEPDYVIVRQLRVAWDLLC